VLRRNQKRSLASLLCIGFGLFASAARPVFPAGLPLKLNPDSIEVGMFYEGVQVRVESVVPRDSKVVVIVRGQQKEENLNHKGKVGPIWVNSGKLAVSNVPSLFFLFSAEPVSSILRRDVIDKYELDELAIRDQLRIHPEGEDTGAIRDDFIKLKIAEGAFRVIRSGWSIGPAGESGVPWTMEFRWPKRAPAADYVVSAYECRNGAVMRQASVPLKVVRVGPAAELAFLAEQHGSLYGLISVLVAVLAGFGIDFLAMLLRPRKAPALKAPIAESTQAETAAAVGGGPRAREEQRSSRQK
jgi:hypothetical protein